MVHKYLQDLDFELVRTRDVLFVVDLDLDGNEIGYDGSFGDSVYLMVTVVCACACACVDDCMIV